MSAKDGKKAGVKKRPGTQSKWAVWEPVIRVTYIVGVAVLTALLASRINRRPSPDQGGIAPGIDPVLLLPVKKVDVDVTSLRKAVESLGKASPVRIELDGESFPKGEDISARLDADRAPAVDLKLRGANVGKAVAARRSFCG